jgi:hypothetical protein
MSPEKRLGGIGVPSKKLLLCEKKTIKNPNVIFFKNGSPPSSLSPAHSLPQRAQRRNGTKHAHANDAPSQNGAKEVFSTLIINLVECVVVHAILETQCTKEFFSVALAKPGQVPVRQKSIHICLVMIMNAINRRPSNVSGNFIADILEVLPNPVAFFCFFPCANVVR